MDKLTAEWIPKDKYLPPHEKFILAYIDMGAINYNKALYVKGLDACSGIDENGKFYCENRSNNEKCIIFISFYWLGRFDQFKENYLITEESPILINKFNITCKKELIKFKGKYPTIDELNNVLMKPLNSWNISNLVCWQSLQ